MRELKTTHAELTKLSDRIVKVAYIDQDVTVTESHIIEILTAAASLTDGRQSGLYVQTGKGNLLSANARKRIGLESKNWDKMAILTHSLAQTMMGNFVMNMKGIDGSLKLFTNETAAINWLQLN